MGVVAVSGLVLGMIDSNGQTAVSLLGSRVYLFKFQRIGITLFGVSQIFGYRLAEVNVVLP